jgi:sugar lactone lactonase YvrE
LSSKNSINTRAPGLYPDTGFGLDKSIVQSGLLELDAPVISPDGGIVPTEVEMSAPSGSVIFYTLDGTKPDAGSSVYLRPFLISSRTTVKAVAVKPGFAKSAETVSRFYGLQRLPKVSISPPGGDFPATVTMSVSDHPGASIYYTTDGTEPTINSSLYSGEFDVEDQATVSAVAVETGFENSRVTSVIFKNSVLPDVSFDPPSGTPAPVSVSMDVFGHPDSLIYYTLDGTSPEIGGLLYSGPIDVLTATDIKAIAIEDGVKSRISSSRYILKRLPTPQFDPEAGTAITPLSVAVSIDGHPSARIYFSTDGSIPQEAPSMAYSTPISIASAATIKAVGVEEGWSNSDVGIASYGREILPVLPTPQFDPVSGSEIPFIRNQIRIFVEGHPDAIIRYETNGSDPTASSRAFPGLISGTSQVKAMAWKAGYQTSLESEASYTMAQAPAPSISPSGTVSFPVKVTIASSISPVFIHYTLDGTEPTSSSTRYRSPFHITDGDAVTIKAFVISPGYTDSDVTTVVLYKLKTISPSSISSGESVGQPGLGLAMFAGTISSLESFGTASISTLTSVAPSSVSTSEAFGTLSISLSISATSITSGESFGTPSVGFESTIFVVDTSQNRVQKFDNIGTFITKFGSGGSGDGQFNGPRGITATLGVSPGSVYVADRFNVRVQKFDSSGNFVTKWGSSGSGSGQFTSLDELVVGPSGNIYVCDMSNARVEKFNPSGTFILSFGSAGSGDGQFGSTGGTGSIGVDSSENLFVADSLNIRVQKFTSTGTFVLKFGSSGTSDGEFDGSVAGIAVDPNDGSVYVTDNGSACRVQKFDSSGNFILKFGTPGSGDGQFNRGAMAVTVDSRSNVYVCDQNRVHKFDSGGNFIVTWGGSGSGDGQFSTIGAITTI